MKRFIEIIRGNRSQRQARKKVTIISTYATVILLVLTVAALIVSLISDRTDYSQPDVDKQTPSTTNYSLSYEKTKVGTLLIVSQKSEAFDFEANADLDLTDIAPSIPKVDGQAIYVCDASLKANKEALNALNKMLKDFYEQASDKELAAKLTVKSAYRSYAAQESLGTSTKGGHSDTHTGMLFDLRYNNLSIKSSQAFAWIYDNAHKYGFIERYPESKSSVTGVVDFDHAFRYVGVPHSTYIRQKGICLEEYIEELHNYKQDSPLRIRTDTGAIYEVFYTKANNNGNTIVNLDGVSFSSVSGDNAGGFIITTKK